MTKQIVELAGWQIEVDQDLNRGFYSEFFPYVCDCTHCTNWRALGGDALPAEVLSFLTALGVDVSKPEEVYEMGPDIDGRRLYGGWYYMSGRILRGVPLRPRIPGEMPTARLANGFQFLLQPGLDGPTPEVNLPPPHLTLWFAWAVPWTLASPPD